MVKVIFHIDELTSIIYVTVFYSLRFSLFLFSFSLSAFPRSVWVLFQLYGHTHSIWNFPGQGLNSGLSCKLCNSWGNIRSFDLMNQGRDRTWTSAVTRATAVRFLTHRTTAWTLRFSSFNWNFYIKQFSLNLPLSIIH